MGAGLSGPVMAIVLARQGFRVDLFDRRPDMRLQPTEAGMSINLTLARRGIHVLDRIGLLSAVMSKAVPLRGRMIHRSNGALLFQPYGKNPEEVIYSIRRRDLNTALLDAIDDQPNISLHFDRTCVGVDRETRTLLFEDSTGLLHKLVAEDFIVGADGVFSTVRQSIHRGVLANYRQEFLEWGYKEVKITAANAALCLEPNVFHMWPRGAHMLMAVPSWDGSYTCTCVLPLRGQDSLAQLHDSQSVSAFFAGYFQDVAPYIDRLGESFTCRPTGYFVTTYMTPWYYKDRMVLVGDACHSFVPFYGQGMNASLEDCLILGTCIAKNKDKVETAFQTYEEMRRPDTDVMADLSKANFSEIRARVHSPWFVAAKRLDLILNRIAPALWVPLYSQIMHTTISYTAAVRRARRQREILACAATAWILSALLGAALFFKRLGGGGARTRASEHSDTRRCTASSPERASVSTWRS